MPPRKKKQKVEQSLGLLQTLTYSIGNVPVTAASYTSDLSDIFLFETTSGVTAYGGGASGLGTGADFAMEGTLCVDKQITASEKGFLYDNVSNFSIGADDHFFIWIMGATPGLNDTRNNRGIVVCIGDDTSNFVKFHVDGSDTCLLVVVSHTLFDSSTRR